MEMSPFRRRLFAMLAMLLRFGHQRVRLLDSLSNNAYGMYWVHYGPVVWLQYALLDRELPAIAKAATVLDGTLAVSWALGAALRGVPVGALLVGPGRRVRDA
jgi:hypothetical protein